MFAEVEKAARGILATGWVEGTRFAVGQNVAANASHDWVVVTKTGSVIALAPDVYEAAALFVEAEAGALEPGTVIEVATDAETVAWTHRLWWETRGRFGAPLGHAIVERAARAFLSVLVARADNMTNSRRTP